MIRKYFPILTILLLGFLLRLYSLSSLPLFGDEIDVGYQAQSLLQTGRDVQGNLLPFYIDSFSESRAPALIYATIPFIKLFGLNVLGVRLVPLLFGLLSTFYFYKLVLLISRSNALSLYSTLALTLTPWHFHYSRTAFELTLLSTLILAGIYYFYIFAQSLRSRFLFLSIILFSLSFYTYNIANIFVPLIFTFLLISHRKSFTNWRLTLTGFIFGLTLVSPIIYSILSGSATNRFKLISIFNNPAITNEIISKRTDFTSSHSFLEPIFHNKAIGYSQALINNYLSAFSPQFLFISGDPNPRHNPPGFNLILLPLVIPLIYGLTNPNKFFLFWLLIAPISSALTKDGGLHASRLFLMVFPLCYFIGVGIQRLPRVITFIVLLLSFISSLLYFHEYFIHYSKAYFADWQYGYQQLFSTPLSNSNRIFVSNTKYESLPRYVFYQNVDPRSVQQSSDQEVKKVIYDLAGFQLNDHTYFINNWSSNDIFQKINSIAQVNDIFYLLQLKDIPGDMNLTKQPVAGYHTLNTVFYPNGQIMGQVIQKL